YIYCVGTAGTSGISPSYSHYASNQVYYAPVSSTGIGPWTATTAYPVPMYAAGCSIYNGYIYCVGTWGTPPYTQVYYAPVSSTGIGPWTATTAYPVPMYEAGCSIYNGYIYCVDTWSTPPTPYTHQVYYAHVSSTGIGPWTATTAYPVPMYEAYCEIPGSGGGYYGGGGPTNPTTTIPYCTGGYYASMPPCSSANCGQLGINCYTIHSCIRGGASTGECSSKPYDTCTPQGCMLAT
ncbi:MAG: hypothetical protein QW530_02145, partial [Candidatus Micrarchaeaceae archaeon]